MAERYHAPKGALVLVLIGLIPSVLTALGLFDLPYSLEITIAGGVFVGAGLIWHYIARFRWRMANAKR
jgi:multisubunit Na+/H+ antiporter MnhG subunit